MYEQYSRRTARGRHERVKALTRVLIAQTPRGHQPRHRLSPSPPADQPVRTARPPTASSLLPSRHPTARAEVKTDCPVAGSSQTRHRHPTPPLLPSTHRHPPPTRYTPHGCPTQERGKDGRAPRSRPPTRPWDPARPSARRPTKRRRALVAPAAPHHRRTCGRGEGDGVGRSSTVARAGGRALPRRDNGHPGLHAVPPPQSPPPCQGVDRPPPTLSLRRKNRGGGGRDGCRLPPPTTRCGRTTPHPPPINVLLPRPRGQWRLSHPQPPPRPGPSPRARAPPCPSRQP